MSVVVVVGASARVVPAMACANHSCKDISFKKSFLVINGFPAPQ